MPYINGYGLVFHSSYELNRVCYPDHCYYGAPGIPGKSPSMMRLIVFLLIGALQTHSGPTWAAEPMRPVNVFLLAGQSNMQGQGVVAMDDPQDYNGGQGNLVWSMKHSVSQGKMIHLREDSGKWAVRDDVEIRYKFRDRVRQGKLTIESLTSRCW